MNLYTCKHFYPNLIIILATIVPIILSIILLKKNIVKKGIVILIISLLLLTIYIGTYLDYYFNVYALKDTEAVQITEGQLLNLKKTEFWEFRYDSFFINDIEFFVSCNPLEPGYHQPAAYGGCLSQEGMRVKITYIEYNGNKYIMSIDKAE